MRIHFFTAPFYFAFIWFRVQGSRGGFAATIPMTIHAAPSSGRGANDFLGNTDYIVVIRGQGLAFLPHVPRCSAFLICLSYRLCPIRPCGAPSPRGKGCDTRIPSSKKGGTPPL